MCTACCTSRHNSAVVEVDRLAHQVLVRPTAAAHETAKKTLQDPRCIYRIQYIVLLVVLVCIVAFNE